MVSLDSDRSGHGLQPRSRRQPGEPDLANAAEAGASKKLTFVVGSVLASVMTLLFFWWVVLGIDGARVTLEVDDIGQGVAAWCATAVCGCAASRRAPGRATWMLFSASSFAWGAGEAVWCYYALLRNVPVPFPSLADVGFLSAVPLAVAGLLLYPSGGRRSVNRIRRCLDSSIVAISVLFASWATVLGPIYQSHRGSALKQVVSLAYPVSDVVMVSLVIILIAGTGGHRRLSLGLLMAGVVAFAVSDSAFAYLTEVNAYSGGSLLDTGWVAGYLLVALGALWAMTVRTSESTTAEESTVSLVAP
jgi:diguanylate cyclase